MATLFGEKKDRINPQPTSSHNCQQAMKEDGRGRKDNGDIGDVKARCMRIVCERVLLEGFLCGRVVCDKVVRERLPRLTNVCRRVVSETEACESAVCGKVAGERVAWDLSCVGRS